MSYMGYKGKGLDRLGIPLVEIITESWRAAVLHQSLVAPFLFPLEQGPTNLSLKQSFHECWFLRSYLVATEELLLH